MLPIAYLGWSSDYTKLVLDGYVLSGPFNQGLSSLSKSAIYISRANNGTLLSAANAC